MRAYHGTPCSGGSAAAVRFLTGRSALVPFFYQENMAVVAEVCSSFVFDNSAFTIWKKGGVFKLEEYLKWCDAWHRHPGFDWALIPDVIDGTVAENDARIDDWPRHIRGVPVWHMHESLGRLLHLALTWPIVAIGSSGQWRTPGTDDWWVRMAEAMKVICDKEGRPICRLHGLRMLSPKVFTRLPLSSADSTNASVNAGSLKRFGMYLPPTAGARAEVIAMRIESNNSSSIWTP